MNSAIILCVGMLEGEEGGDWLTEYDFTPYLQISQPHNGARWDGVEGVG